MKTFMGVNLGCKVNAYEIDAIANILEDNGYILDNENPDMIVAVCGCMVMQPHIVAKIKKCRLSRSYHSRSCDG